MSERKGLFSLFNIDSIFDNLSGFVEKKIALYKIELKEDAATVGAKLVILAILSLSLFMIILFISLAGAISVNLMLKSEYLGFVLVSGFYVVLFAIFGLFQKKLGIEQRLERFFMNIFKGEGDEDG